MAYQVDLAERALKTLNALVPTLRTFVESRLVQLGESPSSLSSPVISPPHPPGGMVYEFDYEQDSTTLHHFGLFFRYASDEARIVVIAIGHTALDRL